MASYFARNQARIGIPLGLASSIPGEGLRRGQRGALHALGAHFSLEQEQPAMIVMPTGSGKTAVLMLAPFLLSATRVLIITPSRLVRHQIALGFASLDVLRRSDIVPRSVKDPKVVEVHKQRRTPESWEELRVSDVVVAIPNSISPGHKEIAAPPADLFDLILVDEAHHLPATTWTAVLEAFPSARRILFTATPFRRDEQEIKGEPVYAYPIAEAVREGIFSKIDFVPVIVPTEGVEGEAARTDRNDRAIARAVDAIFRRDRADGFEHLLMVRTDERARAEALELVYAEETALRLAVIHSGKGTRTVDQTIQNLRDNAIDGIICVDMLGEGFDLPKLKIAGIHAPHKSLSATLQFIGRFARSGPDNLGPATFLAVPNDIALQSVELYEESASWQDVIPGLLEQGVQDVVRTKKVLSGYKRLTDDRDDDTTDEVSLFALRPYFHVRVYDTFGEVKLGNTIDFGPAVVIQHRWISPSSAVLITKEQRQPKWTTLDIFPEVTHELIVVYVSTDRKYLFTCSSYRDSDSLYEQIAEQLCPRNAYPVSEDTAKKALLGLKEQEQFMVGLRSSLHRSRAETYRMVTGRTVNRAIQPSDGQSYTLGHSFGTALEGGKPITIGWSGTGKIWSNTSHRIPDLIEWCERLALRFASPDEVLTDSELDFFRTGTSIAILPEGAISAEWDEEVYSQPMSIRYLDSSGMPRQTDLTNTDLEIDHDKTTTEAIRINLSAPGMILPLDFRLDRGNWFSLPEGDPGHTEILRGRQQLPLVSYLNDHPLMIYFWDFANLVRDTYYPTPSSSWNPFLPEWIETVDWDSHNVDVGAEVAPGKDGKMSVHEYTEARVRAEGCNLIFFDHLAPEYADFITVKEEPSNVQFTLYHCKSTKKEKAASRVTEIYEVAGQVEKSLHYGYRPATLRARMEDRGAKRPDRFLHGDLTEMDRLIEVIRRKRPIYRIVIVHPGLSRGDLNKEVGGVLGAADGYLARLGYDRLQVLASL